MSNYLLVTAPQPGYALVEVAEEHAHRYCQPLAVPVPDEMLDGGDPFSDSDPIADAFRAELERRREAAGLVGVLEVAA